VDREPGAMNAPCPAKSKRNEAIERQAVQRQHG
jgi:hypothetical protein